MKMVSIQAGSVGTMDHPQGFLRTLPSSRRVAEWLPAPQVVRRPVRKVAPSKSVWIPLNSESLAEKGLWAGLVLASAIGIGYGFNWMLNLVAHWAAVSATLHAMIQ